MGGVFSGAHAPTYPSTGKGMIVTIRCSNTGKSVDLSSHRECQVTSDWTSTHLKEAIEVKTGVHRLLQKLIFAGKVMEEDCTLQAITGFPNEQLPDKVTLFLLVDQTSFPQKLGPFQSMRVPLLDKDVQLPNLTQEFKDRGFYWEMKAETLESHGLRPHSKCITGQVSPMHPIPQDTESQAAQEFAWSYPIVNWEHVKNDEHEKNTRDDFEDSVTMKSFLSIGGFIYFDAKGCVVGAATLGRLQQGSGSDESIEFKEPERWKPRWTSALAEKGRFQPVTMQSLVKMGAKWICWLRPNEVMENKDDRELQPQVPYGGFVFLFHDNVLADDDIEVALDCYFPLTALGSAQAIIPRPMGFNRAYTLVAGHPYPEASETLNNAPNQRPERMEMRITSESDANSDEESLSKEGRENPMNNDDVNEASSSRWDVAANMATSTSPPAA